LKNRSIRIARPVLGAAKATEDGGLDPRVQA